MWPGNVPRRPSPVRQHDQILEEHGGYRHLVGAASTHPRSLITGNARVAMTTCGRTRRRTCKCRQHCELAVHEAPVPPQQMVLVPLPAPSAQIRSVLSAQHCSFVEQNSPAARGVHRGHRRRRFRLRFLASASPERAASPKSATADAAAAPTADLRVVRRVLAPPTCRVSASNSDPSTATSRLGDAGRRPSRRNAGRAERRLQRTGRRREAAVSAVRVISGGHRRRRPRHSSLHRVRDIGCIKGSSAWTRLFVEFAPGRFVAGGFDPTFTAGAEAVDGALVLLLRRAQEVRG